MYVAKGTRILVFLEDTCIIYFIQLMGTNVIFIFALSAGFQLINNQYWKYR